MLKKYVLNVLSHGFDFELTKDQNIMLDRLSEFIVEKPEDTLFLIRGFAGTGKTTMINRLVQALDVFKIPVVLMAPTGRAAKVLMNYTGKHAYTIHKQIYRQKTSTDGTGVFVLDKNILRSAFFVVDEASMISNQSAENSVFGSGRLLDDLLEYVYSGADCRLVMVGDTAQLPPVGLDISPALESEVIESYGFSVVGNELTEVVRQESESGILFNATKIRRQIAAGNTHEFPQIEVGDFDDVQWITGGELIEKINESYDQYGIHEVKILTRSNKRANLYNNGIRTSVLYRDSQIARSDLLMVVKNNYFWTEKLEEIDFIANGDIVEISHIYGYEDIYGFRFANVSLKFVDYGDLEVDCKIILDTLDIESAALTYEQNSHLFYSVSEDYAEITNKRERWKKIRLDPYFNALQVKFAYAITTHKAQGGQWKTVFVDTGFLLPEMLNREFCRWLYTAFTRPVKKLFLVNFDKRFFEA
ncbi:MAG: AAA family ATPase [Prolixibacteraceae bacterium]|nr:AAA family ATPase [Prolixibacteraceae bacterium]